MSGEIAVDVRSSATTRTPRRSTALKLGSLVLERYALILITVGIVVFFAVYPKTSATFPSAQNMRNVIGDQSVLVIVALASLFPLICGEFDFSVGPTATASQIAVAAAAGDHHLPVLVAIVIAITVGV